MRNDGDGPRLVGPAAIRRAILHCEEQLDAFRRPEARRVRWRWRAEAVGYPALGEVLRPEGQGLTRANCERAGELLALIDPDAPSAYGMDALQEDGIIVGSDGRLHHARYPEPMPPVAEPKDERSFAPPALESDGPLSRLKQLKAAKEALLARYLSPAVVQVRWRLRAEGFGYLRLLESLRAGGVGLTLASWQAAIDYLDLVDPRAAFVFETDALEEDGWRGAPRSKCWTFPGYSEETPSCGLPPAPSTPHALPDGEQRY